jgi:rhamnose utilization protein RhaD (predicted bifunctional aldolase and dehydrogenase)
MPSAALQKLVEMSRELGLPEHDLAILGEGNTSATAENGQFWLKASGTSLRTITEDGFVLLNRAATVALLDTDLRTDTQLKSAFSSVLATGMKKQPSVEAILHAFFLGLDEVAFVGHTHPTSVNAILCSVRAEELITRCIFPDQIVCCGPAPVFVPYTDPGLPLAREVRKTVAAWMQKWGLVPKSIMIQNHGLFALGATSKEVLACTLMWEKTARIIMGALACGGPRAMTTQQIEHIWTRPDEKLRQKIING